VRRWLSPAFIFVLLAWPGLAPAQQMPGPVGEPEGVWRAQIHWVPLDIAGTRYLLYTRICRPSGDASARAVVIAHGSPPSVAARPRMTPLSCDSEAARWFLDRGYAVIASMRRGFGATGGVEAEFAGSCNQPDYVHSGIEAARDLVATVDYAAALPFVLPQGVVVVGQSAGGLAALAYNSLPHPIVTALVSMAGGRGGHAHNQPNSNCQPELLSEAAGRFGRTATTPMLWIYAENDSFFAPAIAAAMYAAYTQNGGTAEFAQLGPYDSDGHRLFFGPGGSQIWGPLVERYLASRPAQ